MNEENYEEKRITWNCVECNTPLAIKVNSRYYNCGTCGTTYRFSWRGHQIESHFILTNIKNVMDSAPQREELQQDVRDHRERIQELNELIRRVEMSKGGERLRVISILIILGAFIYFLFRLTVHGIDKFLSLGISELSILAAAAIAVLILLLFQIKRSTIVRKCNHLIRERTELEKQLDNTEAALDLHFDGGETEDNKMIQPEKTEGQEKEEPEDPIKTRTHDIIEKFANKNRSSRSRLNLRDVDND